MAAVNLGRVGFVLRGAWDSTTQYNPFDVVFDGGNTYVATVANTNVPTSTASTWQKIAGISVSVSGTTLVIQ